MARNAILPTVPWQRCLFHLQLNAQHYVPRRHMERKVTERIRAIFIALDNQKTLRLLNGFLDDYRKDAPNLVKQAEPALPESLVMVFMPKSH